MTQFTLDNIRDAAEKKYGSMDVPVGDVLVRLLNPLRLTKEKRSALIAAQKDLEVQEKDEGVENVDQVEVFQKILRLVADTESHADALLTELGDDLAVLASVFEMYSEGTQAGEASASQN